MSNPASPDPSDAIPPRLEASLADVDTWFEGAGLTFRNQLADIEREEERLNASIEEFRRQLLALSTLRAQIKARAVGLDVQVYRRTWEAVTEGLTTDRALVESRAALLIRAQAGEKGHAEKLLDDPLFAEMVAEYERYLQNQATIADLPPSYQEAIRAHHEAIRVKLEPLFQQLQARDVTLELPMMRFSVVLAVERSDEGRPELLQILAPVDADLYTDWVDRQEDLSTWIAYRLVEFAARFAQAAGAPDAPITYTELAGHLAIRVALGDASTDTELEPLARQLLEEIGNNAAELQAVKLAPWPIWIGPEVLDIADTELSDRESWSLSDDDIDDSWHGDPPEAWDDTVDLDASPVSDETSSDLEATNLPSPHVPPEPIPIEVMDDSLSIDESLEP